MIFVLTIINNVNNIVRTKIIGHYSLLVTRNTNTLVSGRSNGRGKWENLEKIAFRKRQKAMKYGLKKLKGKY